MVREGGPSSDRRDFGVYWIVRLPRTMTGRRTRIPHERSGGRGEVSCGRDEIRGKPRGRSRISLAFNPGYLLF
jgi:hypothetical protein